VVRNFGLNMGLTMEVLQGALPQPEPQFTQMAAPVVPPVQTAPAEDISQETVEYGYSVLPIDFGAAASAESHGGAKSLHNYVNSLTPSKQNEFTGMFKGKNLILITAEAFSAEVIDPELTPTLYRMATKGIQFKEYYQPAWGASTTTGEFSNLTGLVPTAGGSSMNEVTHQKMFLTMGHQLQKQGYHSTAYHNHLKDFYHRNNTHPHLGYDEFLARFGGLEITGSWPESDLEMIDVTVPQFIDNQPFSIYYMTVSGHCEYNFSGNMMAARNKDAVAHLDYSEPVRAYLACNLELEYAMKYLLEQLELAGKTDDTVIVMTSDHYPYGFENSAAENNVGKYTYFNELAGHEIETNAEIHKNACIIWSGCIEDMDIVVDEPCYSLDILPTVSNLFGLEYDSRMLTGRDVFSGEMPLVLFRNYSWITDRGYYNAKEETFTPAEGVTFESEEARNHYIKYVSNLVKNKINYAKYILEEDYYGVLFGEE